MAKKSKKHKKHRPDANSIFSNLDYEIDESYKELIRDIEAIQYEVYLADRKKKKKSRKKARKKYGSSDAKFLIDQYDAKARVKAVYALTDDDFVTRVAKTFEQMQPVVIIIAKLVCALICAVLSVDAVKANLTKDLFDKLNKLYVSCKTISSISMA